MASDVIVPPADWEIYKHANRLDLLRLIEEAIQQEGVFQNIKLGRTMDGDFIDPDEVTEKRDLLIKRVVEDVRAGRYEIFIIPEIGGIVGEDHLKESLATAGLLDKVEFIRMRKVNKKHQYYVVEDGKEIIIEDIATYLTGLLDKTAVFDDVFDSGDTAELIAEEAGFIAEGILLPYIALSFKPHPQQKREVSYPAYYDEDFVLKLVWEWFLDLEGMNSGLIEELEFLTLEEKIELICLERFSNFGLVRKRYDIDQILQNREEYEKYRNILIISCILGENIDEIRLHPLFQKVYEKEEQKLTVVPEQ